MLLSWSLWFQSRFNIRFQRSKPNNHTASIFSLHLSAVRKCSVSHFQLKTAWVMIVQFANHFLTLCLEIVKKWVAKSQPSFSQILHISPVKDKITEPTNFFNVAIFEVGHPNESNPPIHLHLIFEISSSKNLVQQTGFFVYVVLGFCRLHRQ